MRRAICLLTLLGCLPAAAAAQVSEHALAGNDALLPPFAVAGDAGLLGLYHNPAALALPPGEWCAFYLQGLRGATDLAALEPAFERRFTGDWSAALGGRLAFGVDHRALPAGYDYTLAGDSVLASARRDRSDRYNLGLAQRFEFPAFALQLALGGAYRWTRSDAYALDGLSTWDLGAVLRWGRWASVGLVGHNLGRPALRGLAPGAPASLAPSYDFGFALRPRRHWATLSFDITQREIADEWKYETRGGVALDFSGRVRLRFDWTNESRFGLGLFVAGGPAQAGLALGNRFTESEGTTRGALCVELRNRRLTRPLLPRRHFLELRLADSAGRPAPPDPVALVERARAERDVAGVLLYLEQPRLGLAQREELRRALLAYRRVTGRPVVAFAQRYSEQDYYLASAASQLLISPEGLLHFSGPQAHALDPGGLVARLGLRADLLVDGEANSAPALLSGSPAAPAALAADSSLAMARFLTLCRGVAEGRSLPLNEVPALLGRGLILPEAARSLGLVDALVAPGALREWLAEHEKQGRLLPASALAARRLTREAWGADPAIAILQLDGLLVDGASGVGILGPQTGVGDLVTALETVRKDPRLRGALLRVNSGGGSLLAAERLREAIIRTRARKPVVVSIGEAGAGAAYLAAVEADRVFANRCSVTGGIGVWGGKLQLGGLLERLGIGLRPLAGDTRAIDLAAGAAPYSADARAQLQAELARRYRGFLGVVAARRHISEPEVDLLGRGRGLDGNEALQSGLLDEIGGQTEALAALRRLARLSPGEPIELVLLPAPAAERPWPWSRAPRPGLLPGPGETLPDWIDRLEPFGAPALLALDPVALAGLAAAPLW
jgi:protease-4